MVLYGLVKSLEYLVRLNDLKTAQHFRARLALALRHPNDLPKPSHDDLKELFSITGLWVRNIGDRHDTSKRIRHLVHRIIAKLKTRRSAWARS
jgi:hypothetical protein